MRRNKLDFTSDKINIFLMVLDKSGSMACNRSNVKDGMNMYKESFESFPEKGSIAVSVCMFSEDFEKRPFEGVDEIDFSYYTDGGTALYYSICKGAEYLQEYIQEIIREKNIIPNATFIFFSDGEPCCDTGTESQAKEAIEELNLQGITTVFVAFGDSIEKKFGERLGFLSVKDVRDRGDLETFLGKELSESCKEQSKSMKGLGANFFSKAVDGTSSSGYSAKAQEVLEDDSWLNDI